MRVSPEAPIPDWSALETSFEHNAPDHHAYLDLQNGQVVTINDTRPEDEEKRQQIARSTGRFIHLDPASSREQYRWMERFIATVEDGEFRSKLLQSIDGKGAFRRFKDVLLSYPVERDRWFSYRANLLHIYIDGWLANQDIVLGAYPPWGKPEDPPEPNIPLEKPASERAPGPSETLRRTARDLIDRLPAIELPAAIAYLQYLLDKQPSVHHEPTT